LPLKMQQTRSCMFVLDPWHFSIHQITYDDGVRE
jgi:hypothetical protein